MKKQLSKSEIKELNRKLKEIYNIEDYFQKKEKIENIDGKIVKQGKAVFFFYGEKIIPTLKLLLKKNFLKKVVVDMGAVKFVTGGADIMRPGIVRCDPGIIPDDIVVIVDEKHGKPLAVGEMIFSGAEMMTHEKGNVIKNLHHIGDKIWNS